MKSVIDRAEVSVDNRFHCAIARILGSTRPRAASSFHIPDTSRRMVVSAISKVM